MNTEKILQLNGSLRQPESLGPSATYQIPVTINNRTDMDFQKADVAIKDEGQQYVGTATFGRITARTSATRNVGMPGGVESAAYNIWPDVGDKIFGMGFADNAGEVIITIDP